MTKNVLYASSTERCITGGSALQEAAVSGGDAVSTHN